MISVLIPTKGRPQMLADCVRSIDVDDCKIFIIATCDSDVPPEVNNDSRVDLVIDKNLSIVGAVNHMAKRSVGHIQMLADDMVLEPGALSKALEILDREFNCNGVIGYAFTNMQGNDDAITLIGRKYYEEKCPDGNLYFPGYEHFFSETEFGYEAKQEGKFKFVPECRITHYHPAVTGKADLTHTFRRGEKWLHDSKVYEQRRDQMACGRVFHG